MLDPQQEVVMFPGPLFPVYLRYSVYLTMETCHQPLCISDLVYIYMIYHICSSIEPLHNKRGWIQRKEIIELNILLTAHITHKSHYSLNCHKHRK